MVVLYYFLLYGYGWEAMRVFLLVGILVNILCSWVVKLLFTVAFFVPYIIVILIPPSFAITVQF